MPSVTRLFIMVVLLGTGAQVSADLYLASLPTISHYFDTSITASQLTVSVYIYGMCCSQFIYGPLSDGIGRKKPILFGLILCTIGTLICAIANVIEVLVIGRLIQGLGAGAGLTLARSTVRDLFSGEKIAKFSSYFALFSVAIMASAPLFGSYLLHFFGWRSNFIFLGIYFFCLILLMFFALPETNKHLHPENLRWPIIKKNAKTLFTNPIFLGYSFCGFFSYGGVLTWLTTGPVLLQKSLGLTPIQYGWTTLGVAIGYAIGGFINGQIVLKFGINKMLGIGAILMIVASLLLSLFAYCHILTLSSITFPVMLFLFSTGFIFANSLAGALNPFPKIAGFASSIFGSVQILGGAIYSTIISYSHTTNQYPLSITLFSTGIGILLLLKFAIARHPSVLPLSDH
jgi:Bcr/CflA subfamily drug resistance transporter